MLARIVLPCGFRNTTRMASSRACARAASSQKLFKFGVIADIQYADIPDGKSFHGVPRFYRNSLVATERAVNAWQPMDLDFIMHFGDILDGFQPKDQSDSALASVLAHLNKSGKPVYHMLGNHCLYNLPRASLNDRLGIRGGEEGGVSYYSFCLHASYRFVVLDAYDVSVLGWPADHPLHLQATQLLELKNPSQNKNDPTQMEGLDKRFVAFGGGVSDKQLAWLRRQLQEAEAEGQKVVVCSHLPFCPGTCPPVCLLWNYDNVLAVLQQAGNVVLTISGHVHQNGYIQDESGIHHVVLPAVLETPPGRDAYGHMEMYDDRVVLCGVDTMMSLDMQVQPGRTASIVA